MDGYVEEDGVLIELLALFGFGQPGKIEGDKQCNGAWHVPPSHPLCLLLRNPRCSLTHTIGEKFAPSLYILFGEIIVAKYDMTGSGSKYWYMTSVSHSHYPRI